MLKNILLPALLVLAVVLTSPGHAQESDLQTLDQVLAVVNNSVVTQTDLDREMHTIIQQSRQNKQPLPTDEKLRKQVLERLILQQVQIQQAKRMGLKITDDQLNSRLRRIAASNKLSLEEFRQRLIEDGFNYPKFREDVRRDMLIQQVRKRLVENKISISEQEIDEFLDANKQETDKQTEHHLRHIQIAVPEGADAATIGAAKERAEALLARARGGENFSSLAIAESNGQNALEGGDLGWRTFNQIPARFAAALEDMQPGDTSDVLQSAVGFHIIKLEAKRGEAKHVVRQTHARHILLKTNVIRDEKTAKTTLETLRERALQGDDFGELAKAHSEDYASAGAGGDLGWYSPGKMVRAFEEAANELEINAISEPFESPYGWHLLQVLARRDEDNTAEYLRTVARENLLGRKAESEIELWVRRLRDEAFVEYRRTE